MDQEFRCPECSSADVQFVSEHGTYYCNLCKRTFQVDQQVLPMRIFLSYGRDDNEKLVIRIKGDLEKRGHDVWFDKNEVKSGHDWRRSITDGITGSDRVLSFLSKHSTREPGVCLDEIAIAVGVKGGNIQTILVEGEQQVKPPASISHIQWLDMHDWKERRANDNEAYEKWYEEKVCEIIAVIECAESRRFAGEIDQLAQCLKPISSDSRIHELIKKGLVGRNWLVEAIEEWRGRSDRSSRLFWIMGAPGVGKSAFVAHLAHYGRDKVIAVQFCQYDKPDHRSAQRVVRTLAFQIATRIPDFRKLLLTLPEIKTGGLDQKNAAELFDYLLANPLGNTIDGGRERYLIVIDALDEAGADGRNELVEMLAHNASRLPDWIGLVVTSRPESHVVAPLQGLRPQLLNTATEENCADIREFLGHELASYLENRPDSERLVEQILEKSEGVFLYVECFCHDLHLGHLSLDRPEEYPLGLSGIFYQYFHRQFPDLDEYRTRFRPAISAIIGAREPLPLPMLQRVLNCGIDEARDFARSLGSLFPLLRERDNEVVAPYHKSLTDWLDGNPATNTYAADRASGAMQLASICVRTFSDVHADPIGYVLRQTAAHLLSEQRWGDLFAAIRAPQLRLLDRWTLGGELTEGADCLKGVIEYLTRNDDDGLAVGLSTQLAQVYARSGEHAAAECTLRDALQRASGKSKLLTRCVAWKEFRNKHICRALHAKE